MSLKAGPKQAVTVSIPPCTDPVDLAERVLGKTLYSWQRDVLMDFYKERPRLSYVQVPRRNGKSFIAAVLAIYELCYAGPERHCYVVSDSERNLNSVLMREVRSLLNGSPLKDCVHQFKAHIECPETGSFIQTRPGNFNASQGVGPHLVLGDEIHIWKEEVFGAWQMSGASRGDFAFFAITTPGYDLNSVAHGLYQKAQSGDPSFYHRVYEPSNPDCKHDDISAMREANPALADNPHLEEGLLFNLGQLTENDWKRFHLGMWTSTKNAWLPYGSWDLIGDKKLPGRPDDGTRVWLGFDGSFSGDSTALVGCTADGFLWVEGVWENPGRKGWRVPRGQVNDAIDLAFARYNVVELLCDPPYWASEISQWAAKYGEKRVLEFPTFSRARMAPACTQFFSAVVNKKISHNGDLRLTRHINNCTVKASPQGDYITKEDPSSLAKIDLAVAAVIAVSRATLAQKAPREPLAIA